MFLTFLSPQALTIAVPVIILMSLRTLLLLAAALTSTWSRYPGRRRDALEVLKVLNRTPAIATNEHKITVPEDKDLSARA